MKFYFLQNKFPRAMLNFNPSHPHRLYLNVVASWVSGVVTAIRHEGSARVCPPTASTSTRMLRIPTCLSPVRGAAAVAGEGCSTPNRR